MVDPSYRIFDTVSVMKIIQYDFIKDPLFNGGYGSIYDSGDAVDRTLAITDDAGNTVTLKNEQIGELYRRVKPLLAG